MSSAYRKNVFLLLDLKALNPDLLHLLIRKLGDQFQLFGLVDSSCNRLVLATRPAKVVANISDFSQKFLDYSRSGEAAASTHDYTLGTR